MALAGVAVNDTGVPAWALTAAWICGPPGRTVMDLLMLAEQTPNGQPEPGFPTSSLTV